jgi:hypothetical protein
LYLRVQAVQKALASPFAGFVAVVAICGRLCGTGTLFAKVCQKVNMIRRLLNYSGREFAATEIGGEFFDRV